MGSVNLQWQSVAVSGSKSPISLSVSCLQELTAWEPNKEEQGEKERPTFNKELIIAIVSQRALVNMDNTGIQLMGLGLN